jgi:hypothetical protein
MIYEPRRLCVSALGAISRNLLVAVGEQEDLAAIIGEELGKS